MTTPNPGSPEAVNLGCLCPSLDNCHGAGVPWPDKDGNQDKPSFWIRGDCPLHGAQLEEEPDVD